MIDRTLLNSGNDIPFIQAGLTIHNPTIKEIAMLNGEYKFWSACQVLKFNKDFLEHGQEVKQSNFELILKIIRQKNIQAYEAKINIISLLSLLFPLHKIELSNNAINLENKQTKEISQIDNDNFQYFKEILIDMFCLTNTQNKQYDPSGELAKKIANQLKKGEQRRAQLASQSYKKINILDRYVSVLSVGLKKDKNILMNYTVYQLIDEFNRFLLQLHYDSWVKWRIAGAEGMQEPEDWLKDLYQE